MMATPPSLASRFAAVVDYNGEIIMSGRYDECIAYMRDHLQAVKNELMDLRFATKCEHGLIELGIFASYVL